MYAVDKYNVKVDMPRFVLFEHLFFWVVTPGNDKGGYQLAP
jgi:hypothetical protein